MKLATPLLFALLAAAGAEGAAAQDSIPPHETFTIESAVLGETRRINVYTPPGYHPAGIARYPVLYMPDGGVQEDFPHVAATVDAGIRAREVRPMFVVGIENTERRRDMTGPTEVEEDRRIAPRVGGSAAFRRFIADELMPEVRRRYRASHESAIIGESLAGLFIVETFLLQPNLFDTYIALSPSLWWNGEALVRTADERIKAGLRSTTKPFGPIPVVFLASADEENIVPAVERLVEAFRVNASRLLHWQYRPRPDLTHATIYRAMAPQVLRDLFRPQLWITSVTSPPEQIVRNLTEEVTPLTRGTQVTREPARSFTLMREEYRLPDSLVGSLYVPDRWTKIHLSFDTPDRRVNVTLTDNGSGLWVGAQSPGCSVRVSYLQYGFDGDERHLFDAMLTGFRALVEHCAVGMEDPARYGRLLEAAEGDFPEALRLMKARVAATFGMPDRCTPEDPMWAITSLHPTYPCGFQ